MDHEEAGGRLRRGASHNSSSNEGQSEEQVESEEPATSSSPVYPSAISTRCRRHRAGKKVQLRKRRLEHVPEGNPRPAAEVTSLDIKTEQSQSVESPKSTRPPHRLRRRGKGHREKGRAGDEKELQKLPATDGSSSSSSRRMKDSSDSSQSPHHKKHSRRGAPSRRRIEAASQPDLAAELANIHIDPAASVSHNEVGEVAAEKGANRRRNGASRRSHRGGQGRRNVRHAKTAPVQDSSFGYGSFSRPAPVPLMSVDLSGYVPKKTSSARRPSNAAKETKTREFRRQDSSCTAKKNQKMADVRRPTAPAPHSDAKSAHSHIKQPPLVEFLLEYMVENRVFPGLQAQLDAVPKANRHVVGSQLLLPILIDRDLGGKIKAENEEAYRQIVDYFGRLGLNYSH